MNNLETYEYRKPLRRRVYDIVKLPAREIRDRYLYRRAQSFFREAVDESEYSWSELERFRDYFDYAFRRRKPDFPDPSQRPYRYFPGLRAQPIWDPDEFEFVGRLVEQRDTILGEFNRYRQHGHLNIHHKRLNTVGKWNVLYLHAAGKQNDDVLEAFPESIRATQAMPGMGVVGHAYFSVLDPGTHIPPHCGPSNTTLRVQLRLYVPEGCEMRVGDEVHNWDDGHDTLVFDDAFEHEVWVRSKTERSVLILDFWHPELTPAERWAVATIDGWTPDRRRYRSQVKT